MKNLFLSALAILFLFCSCCKTTTKIACVGDSITEGYSITEQSKYSYPVILENLLGEKFEVLNLGKSATTAQRKGDNPYWNSKEFHNVFSYKPNIIIIALGTNDTKPQNWNPETFAYDYQAIIDTFKTITSNPEIVLGLPVPVYVTRWGINDSTMANGVIPIIKKIAETNHLRTIDLNATMSNQPDLFTNDGIHPNEKGAKKIGEIIAQSIKRQ